MSERFPPRTSDREKVIADTGQATERNTEILGVEDNNDRTVDGKTEDKRHETHNDFVRSKPVEGLELGVLLGRDKYSPHNEGREEFNSNLAIYDECGRREHQGKVDVHRIMNYIIRILYNNDNKPHEVASRWANHVVCIMEELQCSI